MQIIRQDSHSGAMRRVTFSKVTAAVMCDFIEKPEKYFYREITAKSMARILLENPEHYFDCHGNLIVNERSLSPSHFPSLGVTFHAIDGCGWTDDDLAWARESMSEKLDPEND